MGSLFTSLKVGTVSAVRMLDKMQDEIRINYPGLVIKIEVRVPFCPYYISLNHRDTTLFENAGESFENRIYNLNKFWQNNLDVLQKYHRNNSKK